MASASALIGLPCRLDIALWNVMDGRSADPTFAATVTGYVIGERRHVEESERVLFYFHCTAVDHPAAMQKILKRKRGVGCDRPTASEWITPSSGAAFHGGSSGPCSSTMVPFPNYNSGAGDHWLNELSVSPSGFASSAGYKYLFDGWFEDVYLYPIDGKPLEPIPAEWLQSMEEASAACEVRLLSYAFRPWFESPFHALKYLAFPERDVCYSVWLCHRCLTPFFSHRHLATHLEGYCGQASPPGVLIYADPASGLEVRYVDGAQHLHYCRSLALLGKCFLESKLLLNDSDVYEFFTLTVPRAALPYIPGDAFGNEVEFRAAAASYDTQGWTGRVVAGYFSRMKHRPHHALSCILTLPIFQQLRLATFMLDVAYTLMAERQRQCGCVRFCGPRSCDGGAISRPFSPHGQVLLLSYWRRALLQMLWTRERARRERQSHESGDPRAAAGGESGTLDFTSVREMAAAMDIPIATDDLVFLLLNENFAFYAPVEEGNGGPVATHVSGSVAQGRGTVADVRYQLSLIFDAEKIEASLAEQEKARAEDEQRILRDSGRWTTSESIAAHIRRGFRPECMCRDADNELVYNKFLLHY